MFVMIVLKKIIFLFNYSKKILSKLILKPWIQIQISPKSWIRIQIQCIWIHNLLASQVLVLTDILKYTGTVPLDRKCKISYGRE